MLAPLEAWLTARRTLLWWIVAYLLIVVAVSALAHVFAAGSHGFTDLREGGS